MNKIKVTAVSYLNTKPLLYGILKNKIAEQIDLQLDIPSVCAEKLNSGEADLGLIPVAAIAELNHAEIVSDFCIGATGAVKTVCIFSESPIESIEEIYLDYHSRTSVELTKLLLKDYWKLSPKLLPAQPGFETQIKNKTAALIIGDRAIGLEKEYPYTYDLGEIWQKHTGLPFVFAAWVSTKPLPPLFIKQFNQAMQQGVSEIPQFMFLLPSPPDDFDLEAYFTDNISYELDEAKKEGLALFLKLIKKEVASMENTFM